MSANRETPTEDPQPQPVSYRAERQPRPPRAPGRNPGPPPAAARDLSVEHVAVLGEN